MYTKTRYGLVGNFHDDKGPILVLGPYNTREEAEARRQEILDSDGWRILPMWRDDVGRR